jgi:hypothetical protein
MTEEKKHTFPIDFKVTSNEAHTEEQATELMHLAIDYGIQIDADMIKRRIDPEFCYLTVKGGSMMLSNVDSNVPRVEPERIFVSLAVFKALMKGQTTLPVPYKASLQLNDKYAALVTKSGIEVGCQIFTHEKLDELYKLSTEARCSKF